MESSAFAFHQPSAFFHTDRHRTASFIIKTSATTPSIRVPDHETYVYEDEKPVRPVLRPETEQSVDGSSVLKTVSAESLQYKSGYVGAVPAERRWSQSSSSSRFSTVSMALEQLASILTSKVYDVAVVSPLQLAEKLSSDLGNNVWVKREDKQSVRAFYLLFSSELDYDFKYLKI
ncbi:unnamed protein product [Amaranthus hypochondriacus]